MILSLPFVIVSESFCPISDSFFKYRPGNNFYPVCRMADVKQEFDKERSLPVVEETLEVGKQVVEKSRIRIIKKVDEETVEVPLISRSQTYSVERIPLNRYVDEAPPPVRHEGNTMILSIVEEEVVIRKRMKVVEELRITLHENETITSTEVNLRKERIIIEKDPNKL